MVLTPTKAHNQFMPLLAQIPHSLRMYGHSDTELVFTDNVRADRAELERAFPSLCQDVVPVPSKSSLELLAIPSDWSIFDLNTDFRIRACVRDIMEDLQQLPTPGSLYLGMDMEWCVDRTNNIHGKIAVLSIAYLKTKSISLLHVSFRCCFELFNSVSVLAKLPADINLRPERHLGSSARLVGFAAEHTYQEVRCASQGRSHSSLQGLWLHKQGPSLYQCS